MENEEEKPKLSKTEEKINFLNELDTKLKTLAEQEQRIAALVERNEELVARKLLGGQTDAGVGHEEAKKEETPAEYRKRIMGY